MGIHYALKGIPLFALGIAGGALLTMVTAPLPKASDSCSVLKINPKAVTSYVMKPPTQPAPKCEPVIVKQECPAPQEAAPVKVEEPVRKHRRRYRRYWR